MAAPPLGPLLNGGLLDVNWFKLARTAGSDPPTARPLGSEIKTVQLRLLRIALPESFFFC